MFYEELDDEEIQAREALFPSARFLVVLYFVGSVISLVCATDQRLSAEKTLVCLGTSAVLCFSAVWIALLARLERNAERNGRKTSSPE